MGDDVTTITMLCIAVILLGIAHGFLVLTVGLLRARVHRIEKQLSDASAIATKKAAEIEAINRALDAMFVGENA